jgi:SNF2 family DNA or RNA helicase
VTTDYHARYFAYELTRRRAADGIGRLSQSLFDASVDLNPHQIEAAMFALRSPIENGVILADEVGLGKTIEAGVLLCQYWAERRRRLIVVCPASLRRQWAAELEEKFSLPTCVLDSRMLAEAEAKGIADPLGSGTAVIIMSYNFAARQADALFAAPWDLAVIDEAHKLRNVYKPGNVMGQRIKRAFVGRRKVLLTATPLQNSLMELYGLASLIDDHIFGDPTAFRTRFVGAGGSLDVLRGRLRALSDQVGSAE